MRTSSPVPADEPTAATAPAGRPDRTQRRPDGTQRRPDRTQRLLGVTTAVLLIGGLVTAGATGLNWWSRIDRIEASQVELARAVDAEWRGTPEHGQPGRAGGAALVPVVQDTAAPNTGAPNTGAPNTGARDTGAPDTGAPDTGAPGAARHPAAPGAGSLTSDAIARLHLPRLDLHLVVVEGSGEADLLRGPGHIANTPLFGQPGNVGVAGHRYPGVFWDLDRLRDGDPVVVETRDQWYVYRVSREMIVGPSDVDVLAPHPAGAPDGARDFLTLVTCDPVLTTLHRLIRQAVLVRTTARAAGTPPEMAVN